MAVAFRDNSISECDLAVDHYYSKSVAKGGKVNNSSGGTVYVSWPESWGCLEGKFPVIIDISYLLSVSKNGVTPRYLTFIEEIKLNNTEICLILTGVPTGGETKRNIQWGSSFNSPPKWEAPFFEPLGYSNECEDNVSSGFA